MTKTIGSMNVITVNQTTPKVASPALCLKNSQKDAVTT